MHGQCRPGDDIQEKDLRGTRETATWENSVPDQGTAYAKVLHREVIEAK